MSLQFQVSSSNSFGDMRGSPIYTRGAAHPTRPSGKIFIPEKSTWPYLNVCEISTFPASNSFRDMRGPKFTLGGAAPPAPYLKRILGAV